MTKVGEMIKKGREEKSILAKIISVGIILVSIVSTVVLFDKLRFYDFIINGIMIFYLFF